MDNIVDLDEERRARAPGCSECGGPETSDEEPDLELSVVLGWMDAEEACWTQDPEVGPRELSFDPPESDSDG